MNVPIKLVKNVTGQATGGNNIVTETLKYDVFAEILEAGHGFRTYDAQTQLGMVRRFKVRFRFDLYPDGDWKIEFRGKEWTVLSIEQDQERLFYWIITANHK